MGFYSSSANNQSHKKGHDPVQLDSYPCTSGLLKLLIFPKKIRRESYLVKPFIPQKVECSKYYNVESKLNSYLMWITVHGCLHITSETVADSLYSLCPDSAIARRTRQISVASQAHRRQRPQYHLQHG
jgi:hypothetical protein